MRMFALGALAAALFALAACSRPQPPVGRWEGAYESADTLIAARLEIDKGGLVYLTAPDALNLPSDSTVHAAMRQRLAQGLADAWSEVAPRQMDFDGEVFRNPGHIAPQLEWKHGHMTVIVYPGTRPEIRIPMRAVSDFSSDPWAQ